MFPMANHAYAGVWTKGFGEAMMLAQFEALLDTVPFSRERPGLAGLVVRAVEPTETPLVEQDFQLHPTSALELFEAAGEYLHDDTAYEIAAHWDLWVYDAPAASWELRPQRLLITCFGEAYDGGACSELGQFHVDLGFEHLFTGHAGLLGFEGRRAVACPEHPAEAAFLEAMSDAENRREYREKTSENIRKLLDWMQRIAATLPVTKSLMWSEGEENFEARLEQIVATR